MASSGARTGSGRNEVSEASSAAPIFDEMLADIRTFAHCYSVSTVAVLCAFAGFALGIFCVVWLPKMDFLPNGTKLKGAAGVLSLRNSNARRAKTDASVESGGDKNGGGMVEDELCVLTSPSHFERQKNQVGSAVEGV